MEILATKDCHQLVAEAAILSEKGRHGEAIAMFERVLRLDPNTVAAWRGIGECHFAQNDRPAAARAFERANQLSPTDARTLNDIGVLLFHQSDYESSLSWLCSAISSEPDYLDARLNLSTVLGRVTLKNQNSSLKPAVLIKTLHWLSENAPDDNRAPLLEENRRLRGRLLNEYRRRYRGSDAKILLYAPTVSMGALYYIFESWQQCLEHMGIPTALVPVGDSLEPVLREFRPTCVISVDNDAIWGTLTQSQLQLLRNSNARIGLVSEFGGEMLDADFYVTFHLHPEQDDKIARRNSPLLSLPFAFNPLIHRAYPARTLWEYAFVGTNSPLKWQETGDYLLPIVCSHEGILAGTGWPGKFGNLTQEESGLLYNFAAICPNFHLRAQIETGNEVNERTHVLAACGAFQLVDNPSALREMYSEDEIASGPSPGEYQDLFKYYLAQPEQRAMMAMRSMQKAWSAHSQFHRLANLIEFLKKN
jgi:hypothetical protein